MSQSVTKCQGKVSQQFRNFEQRYRYTCLVVNMYQDKPAPKGPQAARWRQRKFRTLERFAIPGNLLPGSLTMSRTRCGKPTCHCAQGEGHEAWIFTFMSEGKQRVERIPRAWVENVRQR